MISAVFLTRDERVCAFTVSGHSGLADEGSDILCAAVTSALRFAEAILNTSAGLDIPFEVGESEISCRIPGSLPPNGGALCQTVMAALMAYFTELAEEYTDNIEVITTIHDIGRNVRNA